MATRQKNYVTTAMNVAAVPESAKEEQLTYLSQYSCKPPPLFLPLISFLQLIIFIWQCTELSAMNTPVGWNGPALLFWKNESMPNCNVITERGCIVRNESLHFDPNKIKYGFQIWRYVTYAFVHSGFSHILFNIILQLVIGVPLEMVHRWHRILPIYFAGVLAGSFGNEINPNIFCVLV